MNKTSNVAFELAQDIYTLGGDVAKLFDQYDTNNIGVGVFNKKLYVYACEASYLQEVVRVVKNSGYKFMRYEKEINLLDTISEDIYDNLDVANMDELSEIDMNDLTKLATKYDEYVPIDDISDELSN